MSKQSEAKAKQNYRPKAEPRNCGNCSQFQSDRVQVSPPSVWHKDGWWGEKNLRCGIGGFAVKKGGDCDEFVHMTDKDLIYTANIAAMLGISRAWTVNNVTKRPDFPKPRVNLSQRLRRWSRADVSRWMQQSAKT